MSNFEVGKKYIRAGYAGRKFDTVYTVIMADSKGAVLENPRGRRDWYNADEHDYFQEFKTPREFHGQQYVWEKSDGGVFIGTPFSDPHKLLKVGDWSGGYTLLSILPVDWVEKT